MEDLSIPLAGRKKYSKEAEENLIGMDALTLSEQAAKKIYDHKNAVFHHL
jgi:transaldolase